MATFSSTSTTPTPAPSTQPTMPNAADALVLMAALAGTATSRAARKQYRKMARNLAWSAAKQKVKQAFSFKKIEKETAGMPTWLFLVLVVVAAALGIWLLGLLGFLVVLALAVIIYLLAK